MGPVLAFARSPLGRYALGALAVILALFAIYHAGVRSGEKARDRHYAELVAKAEKKVAETTKKSDAITAKVSTELAAANAHIATLSTKLQSEIPRYVSPEADRRCIVPAGYVRLRDAAGTGVAPVPPGPGGSEDADSGLALSAIAENDIENGRSFNQLSNEVKAWRGWYAAQADLWSKNHGAPKSP